MRYTCPLKIDNYSNDIAKLKTFGENGVIIFGTGNFGLLVLQVLYDLNIKVIAFADNNYSRWNTKWNSYKVISPKDLSNDAYKNTPILLASLNFPYMFKQLKKYGVEKNVSTCEFLFADTKINLEDCNSNWPTSYNWPPVRSREQTDLYIYSVLAQKEKHKIRINSLDLVLTEKCTLKCVDCSNLMQYYAKPVDEDYEILTNSLEKFMNSVDYIYEIRIIGGEPLIYKKIDLVLKQLLSFDNYGKIHIYTNGTIILKEDKMKVFCNEKVLFRISDYGEHSRHVRRLEDSLKKLKVAYFTERITRWQDCAKIEYHKRSDELTKHIFGNCCVNQCITLLHGKIYLCPFAAHAENLNSIPKNKKDSVILSDFSSSELRELIYKLYFKTEKLEACNFCNGRDYNVASVDAAVQTKEVLKLQELYN